MLFTIKRSKWFRGQGSNGSALYLPSRKQCCVGQMCSQLGVPPRFLRNTSTVGGVVEESWLRSSAQAAALAVKLKIFLWNFLSANNVGERAWLVTAYVLNDSAEIEDDVREKKLAALFRKHHHKLVFVD